MGRWTWEKGKDEEIAALKQQLMIEQSDKETILQSLTIGAAKPGQSPGDDRTKEPYDKDWPPPAPLRPKMLAQGGIFSGLLYSS